MSRPDPATEIRMTTLHATRGPNYWSTRPVTRMDLLVGAYEDISSADVPGMTDLLVAAMPGLIEHECSIGERGGFITRLKRGTYAPHIVEHIALELQTMMGHDVGFGRTRGGDTEGEYTLVFEHIHEAVGLRAAALALDVVQRAFAGTLDSVKPMVDELAALATHDDVPENRQRVLCAITGGRARAETRALLASHRCCDQGLIIDVAPSYILQLGLPFRRAEMAIILDADPADVPERYRDPERAQRLVSTVADGVRRDGIVICPAKEWEVQEMAREAKCRVAVFSTGDDVTVRDRKLARAAAFVRDGRIMLEHLGDLTDGGPLTEDSPAAAQVAAALAAFSLEEIAPAHPEALRPPGETPPSPTTAASDSARAGAS